MDVAHRVDLLLEVDTNLSGAGTYTSPWIESAGVAAVLPGFTGGTPVGIEHSIDASIVMAGDSLSNFARYAGLPCRFFRVIVASGTPNATFRLSLRAVA